MHPIKSICRRGWAKHSVLQLSVSIGFFRPNASTKGLGKAFGVTVICFHRIFSPECFAPTKGLGEAFGVTVICLCAIFSPECFAPTKIRYFNPHFSARNRVS
jgi:hypothetical protein